MPQHSARQKRLTTLQEAQQSLDLQVYLNMLQIAIKQVHDDDTDSQSDSMHSPHPDGLSFDVEMSLSLVLLWPGLKALSQLSLAPKSLAWSGCVRGLGGLGARPGNLRSHELGQKAPEALKP